MLVPENDILQSALPGTMKMFTGLTLANMDNATTAYYSKNSRSISAEYNRIDSGIKKYFSAVFVEGMRILDIGCGSGRDLHHLLEQGYDAYGIDPSDEMLQYARQNYPSLNDRLEKGGFPDLGEPFSGEFDGVLCSAVLMHVPQEELFDSVFGIKRILKENGVLLISIPEGRPGIDKHQRDQKGRLFNQIQPQYLQLLFERLGFSVIGNWRSDDALHREGYVWSTIAFRLQHSGILRPIDKVESILTRDRKTATYKLALIRALSEMALTEFKLARWLPNRKVEIPLSAIAQKWLHYYWPLFESNTFIPQIRGEEITCRKPVAFRALFNELIDRYRKTGGLTRFVLDYGSNQLTEQNNRVTIALLKKIRDTIVSGPVTYAGGSLESGRIFQFNSRNHSVIIDSDFWIELSLTGYWIRDAVILRWAELTYALSKQAVKPSDVIDMLLSTPTQERDVFDARKVYANIPEKECAWTGSSLRLRFDVDHIIPFSLWHNNDLWNLMPVMPAVNGQKRDKLPAHDLFITRKHWIVFYWEKLRETHKVRFDAEAVKIIGSPPPAGNWQNILFKNVAEAIEVTAIQKGCERWQP